MSSERKTRAVLARVPDDDQATRLVKYVRSLAPELEVIWGSPHVDMTAWCKIKNASCVWHFTDDHGRGFAPVFGDVIKAFVLYRVLIEGQDPRSQQGVLHAARDLYAVALEVQARIGFAFIWDALLRADWSRAEERIAARVWPSTAYIYAQHLTALATFLEARGVIHQTGYAHRQLRERGLGVQHIADRDKAMAKLPATGALTALADASQHPANEADAVLFAVIKLLLLGFRVHEVLTLADDCWRDEDGRASLVYDIEKKGLGARKIIPTVARAMIRDAVDTLGRLCEPARERARQLSHDPERIPLLVRYDPTTLLGMDQLAPALGLVNPHGVHTFLKRWAIMPVGKRPGTTELLWRVDDVERGLRPLFPRHGYTLDHPDGTQQPLERFLCVVPYHLARRHPSFLRVRPLSANDVHNFLAGDGHAKSVFARYGLCDADGQPWRIHAHQIRHWLTTVAHQGGLPEADLARWMGRDMSQNHVYEHLTSEQRVERIKAGIRERRIFGPIADIFHRLPPEEREEFLATAVEAAHATAHGICVHNFAVKPCDKYLQCLLNCGDLLRTKGDQREIKAITLARGIALQVVQRAEVAEREQPGAWPEAAQWVESCRRTIAGADRALAIEMDPGIPDGTRVAVFPGTPSRAETAR